MAATRLSDPRFSDMDDTGSSSDGESMDLPPRLSLKGDYSNLAGCSNLSLSHAEARECREAVRSGTANEIWIFGFGSLIWKPGFEYSSKVTGYIKDYRRVFHQGSTDHRGTLAQPGRTVTLERAPGCQTWGVAFRLAGDFEEQQETLKYLEWREKQYDVRMHFNVYSQASSSRPVITNALTYIATSDLNANSNWLGEPVSQEALAEQIACAQGFSGPNCDYVYNLATAMQQIGVDDGELTWLSSRVREIRRERQLDRPGSAPIPKWPSNNLANSMRHMSATCLSYTM
ncbi:hypothetical protein WJX73_008488 [Symbiochloris irregularis]|uniref:glutathione-specific gamma-glutamylcyclotransferase n=1 Tax=Symbiochloris irregularis TaxID=706552 RepID=A0AAW1P2H1_9CHLO